ncbi:hypothetical protein [Rhizobium phage RHph_X2_24]|nr:hypothetical protein [Rhizobium phage RHph_X2_24]
MIDWLKVALIVAGTAAATYSGGYILGKRDGRAAAATEALERSVRVLKSRGEIENEISSSDAVSLCAHFGLSDDDKRECVRRLEETNASRRNGNINHPGG